MSDEIKDTDTAKPPPQEITLKVLFFAATRERAGCKERVITLSAPHTLEALKAELYRDHPSLEELDPYLRWAINERFEPQVSRALYEGDTVALIPPISGG